MKPILCALLAAALALVLTACGPREKLVSVPCIDAKDIPAEPESIRPRLTGDAVYDATVLAQGLLAWKAVAIKQRALMAGCIG